MQPTQKSDGASPKDDAKARLRTEVYDVLAAKKGARTVVAAAGLHGMARTVLFDYRSGRRTPHLATAMQMASDLGTTVEKIFVLSRATSERAA